MEIQIINFTGCTLGVVASAMLLFALARGIRSTNWEESHKKTLWNKLLVGVVGWTFLVFLLTIGGAFEYQEGDVLPRFLAGLLIPVAILMVVSLKPSFRQLLDGIPLHILIGSQFFRLFGAVFILVASTGLAPNDFISAGYGDIATGSLALLAAWMFYKSYSGSVFAGWIFTIVGMLDLLNVSRILLMNYPIWSDAFPSTALAGSFPLMIVIGITAPVALILHVYTIRALLNN